MNIVEVDFDTILPVWRDKLWPGRESVIEPCSAMTLTREYDMSFMEAPRTFLAGYIGDKIVAVNSVHLAEPTLARSRGLWVDLAHRGHGYGEQILRASCYEAKVLGAKMLWSFPRQSSFHTYQKNGFIRISKWLEDGEFGPNCYAITSLAEI
jgi:N-acetylglutamate synthase-like GNAT family acetyltransferase